MARAQAGLEYLIIIAAVIGIAAVVVYTLSGVMSSQSSSASIAACKQAAVDCKGSRMLSPGDPCSSCLSACKNPATGKDIFAGASLCCNRTESNKIYAGSLECPCTSNSECEGGKTCISGLCCISATPACTGSGSGQGCQQPTANGCILSANCVDPGTCNAQCVYTTKSAGSSCGSGIPSYACTNGQVCTSSNTGTCSSTYPYSCNMPSATCASCAPGTCCSPGSPTCVTAHPIPPFSCSCGDRECGTGNKCCDALFGKCCATSDTCCGSSCCGAGYECCTFPSQHCCPTGKCGAFGGCSS
jgi:hypothetical protein